jgi:hypothetical protein
MAIVDSYSFNHRFSDEKLCGTDTAGHQEIIHQCHGTLTAEALTRQYFQFAVGCGYAPRSIVDAMYSLSKEYGEAYCGYNENS